jgi:hypothetical protein
VATVKSAGLLNRLAFNLSGKPLQARYRTPVTAEGLVATNVYRGPDTQPQAVYT